MNIHGRNLFAFLLHYVFTCGVMNPGSCNFNFNLCGWRQDPYYRWSWDTYDGYLRLKSDDGWIHRALLESAPVETRGAQCLTFEYRTKKNYQSSRYSGTLNVLLINNDFEYHLVQVQEGNYDNVWQTLSLNVDNGQNSLYVKIRFSASVTRWDEMYLDNVQLLNGSCRFECNFEENLCGATIRSFERIFHNSSTDTWSDHTSKRPGGYYLNLEGRNTYASLDNINFLLYDILCLRFWYRIRGHTSTVHVLVEDTVTKTPLSTWKMSSELSNTWLPATITVEVFGRKMVEICISGILGMHQDRIGLDDIAITSGSCLESTTIHIPVSTFTTKYNASYTSIRTTSARKSTSTTFSTAAATTITTTTSSTETTNRTNKYEWDNSGLQMKEEENGSQVSVGGIIGIVIGCIVISGAVLLVAVYAYRRRLTSGTRTNTTRKSTLTNRTHTGMLKRENEDKSVTSSREKNENGNPTSESACYNVQAEYTTVEKKRQNHNQYMSGSGDVSVYSLAGSLPDKDCNNVSHAAEIDGINREDVNTENNYQYETVFEMRTILSDSTYNHTNEFQDDAYASTIPSAIRPLDETYSHPECKSALGTIYTNTNITDESTHNTTIKSSDQEFDHTYDNTCTVVDDADCTITHSTTNDHNL